VKGSGAYCNMKVSQGLVRKKKGGRGTKNKRKKHDRRKREMKKEEINFLKEQVSANTGKRGLKPTQGRKLSGQDHKKGEKYNKYVSFPEGRLFVWLGNGKCGEW